MKKRTKLGMEQELRRCLTLPLVTFYGVGTIIGAGIYALIGAVSQEAGDFTPLSFLVAAIIAVFTALTYAELSSRYPQSAGSALYINKAFHKNWASGIVGWLVVTTGLVSAGALTHGFLNYLGYFIQISPFFSIPLLILFLGALTFWGIAESTTSIAIMTGVEVFGLLMIIFYGANSLNSDMLQNYHFLPGTNLGIWSAILSGAFIAFYAFIGFEDMVNLSEETINPTRNIPYGLLLALLVATLLYLMVSFIVVTTLDANTIKTSMTPLLTIITTQGQSPVLFSIIAMLAVINGILAQIIMASRLIYGMTRFHNAPKILSKVSKRTQVPYFAIGLVLIAIIILALIFPIITLAKLTSSIMLCIFTMMHITLIKIKLSEKRTNKHFTCPFFVPILGVIFCALFLLKSA